MKRTYYIGTRGSALALYQSNLVKKALEAHYPNYAFELKEIRTKGDKIQDVALSKIGDKGLFTSELEAQIEDGRIHMAVHSLKDLPTIMPPNMALGAILKRAEARDVLLSRNGLRLSELTASHTIATSSLRRKAQLLRFNPQFNIIDIRGNVNTRIDKMDKGYCDAMIMAGAGLIRLGLDNRITQYMSQEEILSAPGQGAIAVEIKKGSEEMESLLQLVHHKETADLVSAERMFLQTLEGGCHVPIGAYAQNEEGICVLKGIVASVDGQKIVEGIARGPMEEAEAIGLRLAKQLWEKGAKNIL